MNYPDAESLTQSYATNHWLINVLIDGLDNEDSLVQPPYEGNCLNWVLGHIISGRHTALKLLSGHLFWSQAEIDLYKTGAPPITSPEQALPLDKLVNDLELSQERIAAALEAMTESGLLEDGETERGVKPIAQHLEGLHWHETYHVGQLELLAELAKASR